jgi:hypothetical protein
MLPPTPPNTPSRLPPGGEPASRSVKIPARFRASARWRSIAAGALAAVLAGTIGAIFWHQDLRYAVPTPTPPGWRRPPIGAAVVLPAQLERLRSRRPGRPDLLHFFNPSCPCSRFNVDHVRALASRFRSDVTVVAVLAEGDPASMAAAYRALQLDVPHYVDADRRLAEGLGVYATPQAAILDGAGRLYFVGNYNRTRFCRDRQTEFARLALEAVVAGAPPPAGAPAAITAFGCPLPARRPVPGARL